MRLFFSLLLGLFCFGGGYAQNCSFEVELGADTTLCSGDTLLLSYTPPSDTISLLWSTGSTDTSIVVTSAGLYTLTASTDSCSTTDTIIIDFIPYPDINATVAPVCQGQPSLILNMATALDSALFSWDLGDGTVFSQVPGADSISHLYPSADTFQVALTVDNGFGCISTDTLSAIVGFQPTAALETADVCLSDTSVIINNSGCSGGDCQYSLRLGDGSQQSPGPDFTSYPYEYAQPGDYTLTLFVSAPGGCADTAEITHTVFPLPNSNFSGLDDTYCQNDPPVMIVAEQAGGTFTGPNVTMAGDATGRFTPAVPGQNIVITYQISDSNNCSSESQQIVQEVFPKPSAGLAADNVCLNGPSNIVNNTDCQGADCQYSLRLGDGSQQSLGAGFTSYQHDYTQPGDYTLTLFVSTLNGCADTAETAHTVFPLPNPNFSGLSDTYCQNDPPVDIVAEQAGGTFTGPNVTMAGDGAGRFTPATPGLNIVITYQITDGNNCSSESQQTIQEVFPLPSASIEGLESVYCQGDPMDTISASPAGGLFLANSLVLADANPQDSLATILTMEAGVYEVAYQYTDGNGCTIVAEQMTRIAALPIADLGEDVIPIFSGQSITLSNAVQDPDYQYLWSTGATTPTLDIRNPGVYVLIITNGDTQCTASDTIFVEFGNAVTGPYAGLQLQLGPNPARSHIDISLEFPETFTGSVRLLSLQGKAYYEEKIQSPPGQKWARRVNTGQWPPGLYILCLKDRAIARIIRL